MLHHQLGAHLILWGIVLILLCHPFLDSWTPETLGPLLPLPRLLISFTDSGSISLFGLRLPRNCCWCLPRVTKCSSVMSSFLSAQYGEANSDTEGTIDGGDVLKLLNTFTIHFLNLCYWNNWMFNFFIYIVQHVPPWSFLGIFYLIVYVLRCWHSIVCQGWKVTDLILIGENYWSQGFCKYIDVSFFIKFYSLFFFYSPLI